MPAEAFAAAGVEPRGELWAAMLDTKAGWDELIRRHAPDAKVRDAGARQPALPEHHQPLRAQPRLPGDGTTARAARLGPLRPDHRRHAAVAERPRRARRARPDDGVLRVAAAQVVDACRTARGCSQRRRSRSTRSPIGSSGRGSCRTSPSSSSCSRRWSAGSSTTPARSRRCWPTHAPTFVVVSTLEAAPTHEATYLARALRGARPAPRRDRRQPGAPVDVHRQGVRHERPQAGRARRQVARSQRWRRRSTPTRRGRRGAARDRRRGSTTPRWSRPAKQSAAPSWPSWRRCSWPCRCSTVTSTTSATCSQIAAHFDRQQDG